MMWEVFVRSRGLCERPWAALTASVGGPGLLLRPQRAVLGCSWGLSGRSWAALGTSVGSLGSSSVPLGSWPGGPGRQSGPFSSGTAIWHADQGGKVAQTRAGRRSGLRGTPGAAQNAKHRPGPFYAFLFVDIAKNLAQT